MKINPLVAKLAILDVIQDTFLIKSIKTNGAFLREYLF